MKSLILAISFAMFSVGCSTTSSQPAESALSTEVANGGAGTTGTINDVTPAPVPAEERDLQPAVPRVKQTQVIGVVRELVQSGCMVKKVASTDGVHYSQLVVTCGDAQKAPAVE